MAKKTKHISVDMQTAIESLRTDKKRPLGKFSPWAWGLEPVRGCNLSCWHCPARLFKPGVYKFISKKVWISVWKIISELTPYGRVEMAMFGEPTLHPKLLELIKIAREISPHSQIQVTTNGTMLIQKKITYKQLFRSGVNIVYVDMYAPTEKHVKLARSSGFDFYKYYEVTAKDAKNAWTFHNDPDIKFIALSEIPDNWPSRKIKRGGLGTFLNNIDFKVGQKFGMRPTENAPYRRCSQPMKYVQTLYNGEYLMCCQDALNTSEVSGNVLEGVDGFMKFWLGEYMQDVRQKLHLKNRSGHPICKQCNIIFSRCDMKFWKKDMFNYYWDGKKYKQMKHII